MITRDTKVTLEVACPFCTNLTKVPMTVELLLRHWENNESIQGLFPQLSADQREALISGVCATCWDNLYKDKEKYD